MIMPTAVIMEENLDKLLEQCETQELEVSTENQDLSFFRTVIIVTLCCPTGQYLYLCLSHLADGRLTLELNRQVI